MGKSCLVTGRSGEILSAVAAEAIARGRDVLFARSGQAENSVLPENAQAASWNRRSPLSARTLVLHAQNLFGRLDEAIVFFSPIHDSVPFHESSIVSIENRVDAEVKGFLFLIRELLAAFHKQGGGRLVLGVDDFTRESRSPLEAMSLSGFIAAAESMFRYYDGDRIEVRLAYSRPEETEDREGFPGFLVDLLENQQKKQRGWYGYASRGGIFGRGSRSSFIDQRSAIE